MSLNWREIDAVLTELSLTDSHIQNIYQRDYRNIFFQIHGGVRSYYLRICLEQGMVRLHESDFKPRSRGVQPRFSEFLRAHIKGGRILSARQMGMERIVRLEILRADEIHILYAKLWGNGANLLLCDNADRVLDAAFRRPGRNEAPGSQFVIPSPDYAPDKLEALQSVTPRSGLQEGQVNRGLRELYKAAEKNQLRDRLLRELFRYHRMRESSLSARLGRIDRAVREEETADEFQALGELLLSQAWKFASHENTAELDDYRDPGKTIRINLLPGMNAAQTAADYFERAKKLRARKEHLEDERQNVEVQLEETRTILAELEDENTELSRLQELEELREEQSRLGRGAAVDNELPGLEFVSGGFRILVGRNSRENDALLRRHTRGNDTWLHTRDYPGGYVFIKYRSGKSIPLEVLLDAGNLALHFSKARSNGQADLYYTPVKYLRRTRDGKQGLVIPTQEKNLFIKADELRLQRLLKGESQ